MDLALALGSWVWAQGSQGPAKPQGALAQHSPTHPDSLALVDPRVGLASHLSHGVGTLNFCPLLALRASSQVAKL